MGMPVLSVVNEWFAANAGFMQCIAILALLALPAMADWTGKYQSGETFLSQGRADHALEQFQLSLMEAEATGVPDSNLAVVHDALGRASMRAGGYRNSKKHFEKALHLMGEDSEHRSVALSNLGQACQALGELAHAEQLYAQAAKASPNAPPFWHLLGAVQFLQKRYDEAEYSYHRAIAVSDARTTAVTRSDLAVLLEARGKVREAVVLLEQAIGGTAAGQERARMLTNLGLWQMKLGKRDETQVSMRRALDEMELAVGPHHPDVARVLREYGQILRKTGRKAEAKEASKRAGTIVASFAGQTNANSASVDYRDLK